MNFTTYHVVRIQHLSQEVFPVRHQPWRNTRCCRGSLVQVRSLTRHVLLTGQQSHEFILERRHHEFVISKQIFAILVSGVKGESARSIEAQVNPNPVLRPSEVDLPVVR